jgi:hypothetical protein
MRNPAWAIACLLLALTSRPLAADPLAELRGAAFTRVPAGTLQLPHGHVLLHDATVATLAEDPAGITGIALGEIEVVFNALPSGPGALNLFAELDAARAGSGAAPLEMPATGAYLSAAADSGVQLASAGKAAASRAWSQLTPAEQAGFTEIYLQAYGDSWVRENEPGFALRAPQGKEVYLAFWSRGQASGATQPQAARYDYRVLADGATLTLADYARGITLVQSPWASEAGELDPNLALAEADYAYTLLPAAGAAGRIAVTAWVSFDVKEPAAAVRFLSAPWCGLPEVRPACGAPAPSCRSWPSCAAARGSRTGS